MKFLVTALLLALLLPLVAQAGPRRLIGHVSRVIDGDTVELTNSEGTFVVELQSIDCPEPGQPGAEASTSFTREMTEGKIVYLDHHGKDIFGHYPGNIYVNNRLLCCSLLENGLAWWDKTRAKEKWLKKIEKNARSKRIGIWASADEPVAPWVYRKMHNLDPKPEKIVFPTRYAPFKKSTDDEYEKALALAEERAKRTWPGDPRMQQHEVTQQMRSWRGVHRSDNYAKVPDEVMERARKRAEKKWPGDYNMQKIAINGEVDEYLGNNN